MFLWCLLAFADASAPPSFLERQAVTKVSRFLESINALNDDKESEDSVQLAVKTVEDTIKQILTIATSGLPNMPEMQRLQRLARQIMNFIFMALFNGNQKMSEKMIASLSENKVDPELAQQLATIKPIEVRQKIHAMLRQGQDSTDPKDVGVGGFFNAKVYDFYKLYYELESLLPKIAPDHFNRNVAIGAFALTFAGVVASIALGATIIGLPAALGLLVSTVGGPGSMAVDAWNKHKAGELVEQVAPDMASAFTKLLMLVEQLKLEIANLQKQVKTRCPNPTVLASTSGPLASVKQFFGRSKP